MEDTGEGDNRSTRAGSMERIASRTRGLSCIFNVPSRYSSTVPVWVDPSFNSTRVCSY